MQKKIIALAIAAAFSAPAFADTSMYGTVDAAVVNVTADGRQSDMLAVSGGLAPSRFGVNSAEDLGNGMKVVVNLEYGLDNEVNATVGTTGAGGLNARQQLLALAGSFGTVATGYLQTTGYDFGKSFDPTAESAVSPLGNITGANSNQFLIGATAGASRAPRALAYISPNMSGLTVAVNYTTDLDAGVGNLAQPDGTTGKRTAWLASANYAQGPLAAGVVIARYMDTKAVPTLVSGANETALGVSYDLEMVKLFATYQTQKADGANDSNKAMSISAVAPVGPGAVALSYAKATMDATAAAVVAPANPSVNASGMTVAWLQGLSKQTTFYAAYTRMSQDAGTNSYSVANNLAAGGSVPPTPGVGGMAAGGSSSMLAVGLSKKF